MLGIALCCGEPLSTDDLVDPGDSVTSIGKALLPFNIYFRSVNTNFNVYTEIHTSVLPHDLIYYNTDKSTTGIVIPKLTYCFLSS